MNPVWIIVVAVLGGLGGLGGLGTGSTDRDPDPGRDPMASDGLVVRWTEGTTEGVGPGVVSEQVVVETEAERAAFVGRLPSGLATVEAEVEVESVDLTTHVIVAGGYHRCQESSRVLATDDGYRFEVVGGDPQVACAWSPYTIDVHQVARPDAPAGGSESGMLRASWSQDDDPDLVQDWRVEPATLEERGELDALVASAPEALRPQVADLAADVDLDREVVVAGGYHDCHAHSEVDDDHTFVVVEDDTGRACEWAPYRVDVHVVAR